MHTLRCLGIALCLFPLASAGLAAQDTSHWGLGESFVPNWNVPGFGKDLFAESNPDVQGSEFRIGVVRGRDLGGDWGVSFVHKGIKDGSSLDGRSTGCFEPFGCGTHGTRYVYRDVILTGIEVHKFVPFVTISRRAQIGMTFAGGIGQFKGNAEEQDYSPFIIGPGGLILGAGDNPPTISQVPAKQLFIVDPVPLARVEISVAAILAPGLKVRVGGGLNMPGTQRFSVSASYLIGAR